MAGCKLFANLRLIPCPSWLYASHIYTGMFCVLLQLVCSSALWSWQLALRAELLRALLYGERDHARRIGTGLILLALCITILI